MTGKTLLLQALGAKKAQDGSFEVTIHDQSLKSNLIFCFTEKEDLPMSFNSLACVIMVYSLVNAESFNSIVTDYFDQVCNSANPAFSFIMLVGTHSDMPSYRAVSHRDVAQLAESRNVPHFEIATETAKGVDPLLKLMRIRASYILRSHPDLRLKQDNGRQRLSFTAVEQLDTSFSDMRTVATAAADTSVSVHLEETLTPLRTNPLLMYLDIVLTPYDTRRIEVCRYDSALTLARKALPGSDLETMLKLSNVITERVNDYCKTIKELTSSGP
eukprot:CAMPEP_0204915990 /NCGR_PEP_ID=MMETSP1397-20131031/13905_1 /ASSEMBLY_ACC=CAM_ASM_000891 /TAXON_ID=49980 /ORGANISM="Climacostomum Climacostomum virens, Strain Stock W-24" /LENGTH=271 /DNA_ID=CAMNT_0052088295 /DNA_START=12 /DNA_END=823 /DNA_ORIENTATION=-